MKRIISFILIMIMVITIIPMQALAADETYACITVTNPLTGYTEPFTNNFTITDTDGNPIHFQHTGSSEYGEFNDQYYSYVTTGGTTTLSATNTSNIFITGLPIGLYYCKVQDKTTVRDEDFTYFSVAEDSIESNPAQFSLYQQFTYTRIYGCDNYQNSLGSNSYSINRRFNIEIYDSGNNKLRFSDIVYNGIDLKYDPSGTISTIQQSDVRIQSLPIGTYRVHYLSADGYVSCANNDVTFSITNTTSFWNNAYTTTRLYLNPTYVEINTKDYETDTGIGNVKLMFTNSSNLKLSLVSWGAERYMYSYTTSSDRNYTTDSSGNLKIFAIPVGEYKVKLYEAVDGYLIPSEQTFTVSASNEYPSAALSTVYLTTENSATINGPVGATFTVKDNNGDTVNFTNSAGDYIVDAGGNATVTVGSAGTATLKQLPTGTFTITPDSISGFSSSTTTVTESGTATITYTAHSATVTAPEGATFTVKDSNGDTVNFTNSDGDYIVDAGGSATVTVGSAGTATLKQLPTGTYNIEPNEVSGFETPTTESITENGTVTLPYVAHSVTVGAPEGATFTVENSLGDTMNFNSGTEGFVYNVAGEPTVTVGSEGTATLLQLPSDTYTIEPQEVSGHVTPITETITESGTVTLPYIEHSANVTAPEGATFTVKDSNGDTVSFTNSAGNYTVSPTGSATVTVGSAGTVTLKKLPTGTYNVDPNAISGFTSPSTAAITENGTAMLTYTAHSANITAPEGATFTVKDSNGDTVSFTNSADNYTVSPTGSATVTVGSAGTAILRQLPTGTYNVVPNEINGYITPSTATITENGTASLTYVPIQKSNPEPPKKPEPISVPTGIKLSKKDVTIYGSANGYINITASGGNSGEYEYSINGGSNWHGSGEFIGIAAGTYTAAARDARNTSNMATCQVAINQPFHVGNYLMSKVPTKANAGTALTIIPIKAPKGYTVQSISYLSNNASIATVDTSGNLTFLTGGRVKITYKMVSAMTDRRGKIRTKTTTVNKTITIKEPVSSIGLNVTDATIARTQKIKLSALIYPTTASNKKVTWTTSNKKVATVSSSGVVVGKSGGTAVITCKAKDGSGIIASCTITVTPLYPASVKMSKTAVTLKNGKTYTLRAAIAPRNTDFKMVTWASDNPTVVTVDAKGRIRAVGVGTATITAATSNGITASCTVTVMTP